MIHTASYVVGLALAAVFDALGLLHVFWALGGTLGSSAVVPTVGGRRTFEPGKGATVAVACALFLAAGTVLGQIRVVDVVPHALFRVGTYVLAFVFAARAVGNFRTVGFFKKVRDTAFGRWDTRLFAPLCLGIALGCLFVAFTCP